MKLTIIFTFCLMLFCTTAYSQRLFVQSYAEHTVAGAKAGMMIGKEFQYGFESAIFYQNVVPFITSAEEELEYNYEKEVFGSY